MVPSRSGGTHSRPRRWRAIRFPAQVHLDAAGASFAWIDPALERTDRRGAAARRRLHDRLWTWLSELDSTSREEAGRELEAWIPQATQAGGGARPMTAAEVRDLVSDGVLTIGAHTVSHCMLSRLSTADKVAEIERSRDDCRRLAGREPTCFAYPHGDLDGESIELVVPQAFVWRALLAPNSCGPTRIPITIPRVVVGDWTADQLIDRLDREWLP